ncbi:MAG: site-2 protease family protein, partial [Gammaproteobacteria bacterium]|nr:site-2 protease family protein [Gammaproteobacteria bacterium]
MVSSELLREGLPLYLAFVFSASLHEAAHAWAAKRGGDLTAYHGGQVSLDPRPHIRREPVGLVFLPLLFLANTGWPLGFASAPYDPAWARRYPRRAAWMALAGPASNLAVVLVCALGIQLGLALGGFVVPDVVGFSHVAQAADAGAAGGWSLAAKVLSVFFSMNLVLFLLNM